jgi:hypothetical protein
MPHPCPHHCPPEHSGGLAAVLVVLAVIVIAVARAVARPVEHAAELALEAAVIAVAAAAGLAAIGAVAYVALRAYRWQATNGQAIARHTPAALTGSRSLSAPQRRAIEPPYHLITGQKPADYGTADLRAQPGVSRHATTKED